jgi:Phage capsid family
MYLQTKIDDKNSKMKSLVTNANTGELEKNFLQGVDKFFADPENSNLLAGFNQKYSSQTKLAYNPALGANEAVKFIGGCTECRTFLDYIVRACNNYGCVANEFVTSIESTNCNQFVLQKTSLISQALNLSIATRQNGETGQSNACITAPMIKLMAYIEVPLEALCDCLNIDAMAMSMERLMDILLYSWDRGILYGNTALPKVSGLYPAITNFDSIDLGLTAAQRITASGAIPTYTAINSAVASILATTKCKREDVQILISPALSTKFLGALDNNSRPILSEITKNGTCELNMGCQKVIECNSVDTTVTAGGIVTSDIFVGIKGRYLFGKYMHPMIQPFNNQSTYNIEIPAVYFYGGKNIDPTAFVKITATV